MEVLAELRATQELFGANASELRELKKTPKVAVVPLTANSMGTPDGPRRISTNSRLEKENIRLEAGITELRNQFVVARGAYRVAVISVMHDAYVEVAEIYALKAEALAGSFEDLMAADKWFRSSGLTSKLPPKFARDIKVPQLSANASVHLDGREAPRFSVCDTSNLQTEWGKELFRNEDPELRR